MSETLDFFGNKTKTIEVPSNFNDTENSGSDNRKRNGETCLDGKSTTKKKRKAQHSGKCKKK